MEDKLSRLRDSVQKERRPTPAAHTGRPVETAERFSAKMLCRDYTTEAIEALVDVAANGKTDASRVSAATALLDRGHGKPVQQVETKSESLLRIRIEHGGVYGQGARDLLPPPAPEEGDDVDGLVVEAID